MKDLPAWLEVSAASRPLAGQPLCGDGSIATAFPGGALLAAIDGLGHGAPAAEAAAEAVRALAESPALRVSELFSRCHERLRRTRGAAAAIASIRDDGAILSWFGVGNVEGVVLKAGAPRERLFTASGIVGQTLPQVRAGETPLRAGDWIVLSTDGILPGFEEHVTPGKNAARVAAEILQRNALPADDALVLVARILSPA